MEPVRDTVYRYAQLKYVADLYSRQGLPIPYKVARDMVNIEAEARAKFTPAQLDEIMATHVAQAGFRVAYEHEHAMEARDRQNLEGAADRFAREATQGMFGQRDGLSSDQWAELHATGKVTFPSTKIDPTQADAAIRQSTKRLDPTGKGWSKKEWIAKLDALTDARNRRDQKSFDRVAAGIQQDPKELAKAADDWATQRIIYGLKERADARDDGEDEVVEADEQTKRKMDVTDAYLSEVEEGRVDPQHSSGSLSDDYLNDDTMRGDIARAMQAHEDASGSSFSSWRK